MILFASLLSNGMFLAGVALLVVILLRRWNRYYGRRRRGKKDVSGLVTIPRPSERPRRSLSTAPAEFLQWQVELHDTARDLKAELDSKMIALQILIQSASQQAARLERLLASCPLDMASGDEPPLAEHEAPILSNRRLRETICKLADDGKTSAEIARTTGTPLRDVKLLLSSRGVRRD